MVNLSEEIAALKRIKEFHEPKNVNIPSNNIYSLENYSLVITSVVEMEKSTRNIHSIPDIYETLNPIGCVPVCNRCFKLDSVLLFEAKKWVLDVAIVGTYGDSLRLCLVKKEAVVEKFRPFLQFSISRDAHVLRLASFSYTKKFDILSDSSYGIDHSKLESWLSNNIVRKGIKMLVEKTF